MERRITINIIDGKNEETEAIDVTYTSHGESRTEHYTDESIIDGIYLALDIMLNAMGVSL